MKLRTKIQTPSFQNQISLCDHLFFSGSCFAENMGLQLENRGWDCTINPLGISYNPISLCDQILRLLKNDPLEENTWFEHLGLWKNQHLHSDFNHPDKSIALINYKNAFAEARKSLLEAKWIIITLGSAWVYKSKKSDQIVNNCHKQEQNNFYQELLSSDLIKQEFQEVIDYCNSIKPDVQFLFTVSPVRHVRHGLTDNQRSKSMLVVSTHDLIDKNSNANYFPSYEIMVDDLRDYRFYKNDLIHPNELALEYIYQLFEDTLMGEKEKLFNKKALQLFKLQNHKVRNQESHIHSHYLEKINQLKAELKAMKESLGV